MWHSQKKKNKGYFCSIALPLLLCQGVIDYVYAGLWLLSYAHVLSYRSFCLFFSSIAHYLDYCYYTRSWSLVVSVQLFCSSVLYWLFWVFCFYIQTLKSVCWHPQNVIWNIFFYADMPPLYLHWYTPSVEKTLYFLHSYISVQWTVFIWVYFWALCSVSLIYFFHQY